jgi:selenocysteine-specific elongation factor
MKHLIMGTAGHVDHGKTSLVKALTNIDCDTHKEEKARGITINLGFSYLDLPNGDSIGIVDVPGHKDFINTMVGGACGIDFVLLVIAADTGIMPQTVEHINIISALGITRGVVALNKIDLVDDELAEMAREEIAGYLEKTSLKGAPIVDVSSLTGAGKDNLVQAIQTVSQLVPPKELGSLFRMYIDRIFSVKGFGSVVTGSVLSGTITTGQDVLLLPGHNLILRVRSIERHSKPVNSVEVGDRAAINLIGLKNEDFSKGMIIANKALPETSMIDAVVSLFHSSEALPLWSNITLISGTFESQARLHLINTDSLMPGEQAIVQIHLNKPAILLGKDKFIMRNTSADLTLGGGYIIDPLPLHHKKRTPKLIDYLTSLTESLLNNNSLTELVGIEIKKELRPFTPAEVADRLNLSIEEFLSQVDYSKGKFIAHSTSESFVLIDTGHNKTFVNRVFAILTDYHTKNPVLPNGMDALEIIGKLGIAKFKSGRFYLDLLLEQMISEGLIEKKRDTYIVKGHQPKINQQTKAEIDWLENEILKCEMEKPVLSEIEERAVENKIQKNKLKLYLSYLAGEGNIKFYQNDFLHTTIIERIKPNILKKLAERDAGMDIPEFKELVGGTKRFRALLTDILEADKLISLKKGTDVETRISITTTGKKYLNEGLS